jgi:hypothetical protein
MKASTPAKMQDGFLDEQMETLIRQLPPEERAKISVQSGRYSGPPELIQKLQRLAQGDDNPAPASD